MQKPFQLPEYPNSQIQTSFDKQIKSILNKYHVVGSEIAVIKDRKTIFSKGYGFANLQTKTPITDNTIVRVASISKMFTGTAIMQLYEQGKINLHDDISNYLGYEIKNPKFPETPITISMLLTHTSSLLDSGTYDHIVETNYKELSNIPIKEILIPNSEYYNSNNFADYKPGTDLTYSNFGIGILGSIVELVSGKRFPKYCTENIFRPLNMDASFDPGDIVNYQNIGTLYKTEKNDKEFKYIPKQDNYNNDKPPHTVNNQPLGNALPYSPAGSVRTSVSDLTHFFLMLMNKGNYNDKQILKQETIDLMIKNHWPSCPSRKQYRSYGYTILHTDNFVNGVSFTGHSAEAYGLIGAAYFIPDKNFAILELFNGGDYGNSETFYSIETDLSELLYNNFF